MSNNLYVLSSWSEDEDEHEESVPLTAAASRHAWPGPKASHRAVPRHRRTRRWGSVPPGDAAQAKWLRWASVLLASLAGCLVAMLGLLGGLIAYAPLRELSTPSLSGTLSAWWPLVIYGPWLTASLCIVRAALYQRQTRSSWLVAVLFSCLAVVLCVAQAPPTPLGLAIAGLPPLSTLIAFHQIMRQLPLPRSPRHAIPRQRSLPQRTQQRRTPGRRHCGSRGPGAAA